jgi:hypothetical protein
LPFTLFGKTYLLQDLRVRIKRIWAPVIAGLLLLMLVLPQSALADPGDSISLSPSSGHCGDLIEATATFDAPGTYRICWDVAKPDNRLATFTASTAGNHTINFTVPETTKGTYNVSLTSEAYDELATAEFTVFPAISINPTEGPVGMEVTLRGYGFKAQDIRVTLFQDGVKKGEEKTGAANAAGSWNLTYNIPATPGGGYTFVVEFEESGVWYDLVGKNFTVTPEISAPSSGKVGQTIEVSGTGFASEEEDIEISFCGKVEEEDIVISFCGKVVETNTPIVADENGSWEAIIVIPPLPRGTHTIDASGNSTVASDVPDVKFTVAAGILVKPSLAYVGDTITVAGGGFATGETGIQATFEGQVVASGITAKLDGTWESSFVLPSSSYGSHNVLASGDITNPAVTTTLTTQAKIEELSPAEGAPGDSVALTGSGFSNSKKLTVTVGGVAVSGNMETLSNGNVVVNFKVPAGSLEGKKTLVVTDEGGATASVDFTVTEKVLTTPQPILPEDGRKLRSGEITFRWGEITSGSNITYSLQISVSPDLATYVLSKSNIETSSYTLPEEEALLKGTYYWRVKIVDNYGNESPWSSPSSFRVSPIPIWVWVVVGLVVLVGLMTVAYRETKFKVTE